MSYTIMVVDDEQMILDMLRDQFEMEQYQVITAKSGEEVLQKLNQQPDIILLDEPTSNLDSLNETVILKAQKSDRICSHKEELFRLLSESVIISTFG